MIVSIHENSDQGREGSNVNFLRVKLASGERYL